MGNELASKIIQPANISFCDYLRTPVNSEFKFELVCETNIAKNIKEMKCKTGCDINGLSNKLLKEIEQVIVKPLTIITNQCFSTGIFPSELKRAKVIPLFKKGDDNMMGNYRPVSLLPCISKVIEKGNAFTDLQLF